MALSAVTIYAPGQGVWAMAAVAFVFGMVNLPSVGTWCFLGTRLNAVLTTTARLVWFNRLMGVLLILSLYPVIL